VRRRPAWHRRVLRLWTAGCLAVLLVLGVSWLGNWSLQWPVLLVPALWALSAALVRRRGDERPLEPDSDDAPSYWDEPDHWGEDGRPYRPSARTDTVEAPWVRDERDRRRD
jgi:hypothetical protein